MKTLKQLRGILELPSKQEESIGIGKIKTPLEEDVEKQLPGAGSTKRVIGKIKIRTSILKKEVKMSVFDLRVFFYKKKGKDSEKIR